MRRPSPSNHHFRKSGLLHGAGCALKRQELQHMKRWYSDGSQAKSSGPKMFPCSLRRMRISALRTCTVFQVAKASCSSTFGRVVLYTHPCKQMEKLSKQSWRFYRRCIPKLRIDPPVCRGRSNFS
mmetsp:Transcript_148755/g.476407  ORF Transcript_148755/g.476407 Transcript_148755/m.476407 type:complete len:125 (-) Transcript_148755:591-965(-)